MNYGSGVHLVDFVKQAEASRNEINAWVAGKTEDKIEDLLPEHSLNSDTRFVLVNAVYFNAGWDVAFDHNRTAPGDFHRLDGSTASVDMMGFPEYIRTGYAEGENYQAIELRYQDQKTSMVVVVPNDGRFAEVDGALSGDYLNTLFASLSATNVAMSMPKFTVKGASISLADQLKKLGMTEAFGDGADFSGMTRTEAVHVKDVLHQAFVKVDEAGTEAAAATAIIGVGVSAVLDLKVLSVDRPFFYFIRDIPTNTVLFVGREMDPTAR